jgi:hypothetical protein
MRGNEVDDDNDAVQFMDPIATSTACVVRGEGRSFDENMLELAMGVLAKLIRVIFIGNMRSDCGSASAMPLNRVVIIGFGFENDASHPPTARRYDDEPLLFAQGLRARADVHGTLRSGPKREPSIVNSKSPVSRFKDIATDIRFDDDKTSRHAKVRLCEKNKSGCGASVKAPGLPNSINEAFNHI